MTVTPFLRSDITSANDLVAALSRLGLERANAATDEERAKLESRMGEILTLADESRERAVALLQDVDARASEHGWRRIEVVNAIRLARALRYANRLDDAAEAFERALALIDAASDPEIHAYRHLADQHYGKCLAELEQWDDARTRFERALEARVALGNDDYLQSTRDALAELEKRAATS